LEQRVHEAKLKMASLRAVRAEKLTVVKRFQKSMMVAALLRQPKTPTQAITNPVSHRSVPEVNELERDLRTITALNRQLVQRILHRQNQISCTS
jgi:hypothetical protein